MTITIYPSRIEYSDANGSFSLIEGPSGFYTRANIFARNVQSGTRGLQRSFFIGPNALIQTFPYATDSNSVAIGNQLTARTWAAGQSSSTHGYSSGGANPATNIIERFPFVSYGGAMTDVGDLTVTKVFSSGHQSASHGYTAGGSSNIDPVATDIQKFPFASSTTNATNLGNLLPRAPHRIHSGISNDFHGYIPGLIDRFSFASESTTNQVVSPRTPGVSFVGGVTGVTHGYSFGGSPHRNTFEKFAFASTSPITNPTTLPSPRADMATSQSQNFGYIMGGRYVNGSSNTNELLKFPFANDTQITLFGTSANTTGISWGGTHY